MVQGFQEEHLHVDEEIRYIIDGTGYEDVIPPDTCFRRMAER